MPDVDEGCGGQQLMIVSENPFEAIELDTKKKINVFRDKKYFVVEADKPIIIIITVSGTKKSKIFLPKEYEGQIFELMGSKLWVEDGICYKLNR